MPDSTTRTLGPDNGTLTVRTGKGGAASKAGHDLLIEVTSWRGTLDLGPEAQISLTADAKSMRVREGSGGMNKLGDDDMANIEQTIDEEVLNGTKIEFHSTAVQTSADGHMSVSGELELAGRRAPISFELAVDDGRLTGTAIVKQSDWGMKPYSALFGTLKVLDDVQITVDAEFDAD
ncbi:MAG TPA: YceI family protein [Solirubrobacteraceae bacterium]|jgi:polyisoprenoid-binding protein YceI